MKQGKLYGVSVGPGDPSLMTLKAVARIQQCEVLAVPRTAGGKSLALTIAQGAVDTTGKQIEYIDFLMTRDPELLVQSHTEGAKRIAAYLDIGQDVAMLSLGDASLYSSYSYLCSILLRWGYEAETIPGVTSFCACAALLNHSLTDMHAPLYILPASASDLTDTLLKPGGKVLMKTGRELPEIKRLINELGLAQSTAVVVDCGLPTQQVFTDINRATENSYFTTILIKP